MILRTYISFKIENVQFLPKSSFDLIHFWSVKYGDKIYHIMFDVILEI